MKEVNKMKKYCITYEVITAYDVKITASNMHAAIKKLKEIIPDAINIDAWRIRNEKSQET